MRTRSCRWGNNDRYFGPFTFARDRRSGTYFAIEASSADEDGNSASFRLSGFGFTFLARLPGWLVPPERKKVYAQMWDAATIERLGRDWYWHVTERAYGMYILDDFVCLRYGKQTHDSSTEQSKGWFMPWMQWRLVRKGLLDTEGRQFADLAVDARLDSEDYATNRRMLESWPRESFEIIDFDGEELVATCAIEEMKWVRGDRWCKWLSRLFKPKSRRSLDIKFSGETGREKGSWKGGTIGHGIEMLPGESIRQAFERYCREHEITLYERSA